MDENRTRRISRREFLKATSTVAAAAILAACGGSTASPPATGGQTAAPTAVPAAQPTAAPAAPAAPAVPTVAVESYGQGAQKTVFWHGLGGADGKTMAGMLKQYADANTDTSVSSETYNWDVFYQKLPTSVVAGTPPDLAIMHEWAIQQFTSQGLLQPVDEIFFDTGLVPKDDFNPNLMKTVTVDGKAMAVPFDNHGWGLFYNTKIIKDAGLDPDNLPKNGTDFIQWATKVTTDENGKHPDQDGFNPDKVKVWAIHSSWQRFTMPSTMWQFGGGIMSEDGKKAILDTDATVASIQYWYDLMYKYRVCPPAVPGTPGGGDFVKTSSLALWWDGSWSLNFFKDNPDIEKVTKAGFLNSLSPDGKQVAKMASHMLVVPVGVKGDGLERAKKLIKWLSDNGKTWANSGQVPARLTVQKDADVQNIWSVKVFGEQFTKIGRTDVPHKAITEIVTAWEAAVSGALAKTKPVKDSLTEGNKAIQTILDRA